MDIDNLAQKADEIHKSIYGETVNDTVLDNLEDNDDLLASNDLENEDEPSPAPAPDKKFEDLEQKYKALKGRYEAETERMSQLLSSAFSEKERLAAELDNSEECG